MFELKLFLGFAPDAAFLEKEGSANRYFWSALIGKEEYLLEIDYQGKRYLGKYLPLSSTVGGIEDTENHLLSLLRKLNPDYPFSSNPPVLITHTNRPNGK